MPMTINFPKNKDDVKYYLNIFHEKNKGEKKIILNYTSRLFDIANENIILFQHEHINKSEYKIYKYLSKKCRFLGIELILKPNIKKAIKEFEVKR